eukprot:TRINITY_DN15862_c0_g1_i1.p1 TRINITY_DN15862_c0_g1~~TRINITY_DN15862_c0_g1_i1.p1  ORF type:complete len:375 (+),score=77.67 TRINITY_DN15862_c0_g1_i1:59-1183(+)
MQPPPLVTQGGSLRPFAQGSTFVQLSDYPTPDAVKKMSLEDQVRYLEERTDFIEGHERRKTATLLWTGSIFGLLGFGFAFIIGLWKFLSPAIEHEDFKSGYGYFPSTVSEMVHDPKDPAGKCFFAFEFIGAIFIFLSWYPWELRNVYIGDDALVPVLGVAWVTFRQYMPATGMMLVATVTTTPFATATYLDMVCISIHLSGAVMLFLGYYLAEAHTIKVWPFSGARIRWISDREARIRSYFLMGIAFNYAMFCVIQGILLIPPSLMPMCCLDEWGPAPGTDGPIVLQNTASGFYLFMKIASYTGEVFCGLFLINSHLAIWYFCSERLIDLNEEHYGVDDEKKTQGVFGASQSRLANPGLRSIQPPAAPYVRLEG